MRDRDYKPRWPTRDMRGPVPAGQSSFEVQLGPMALRVMDLPTAYEPFVVEHYEPFCEALGTTAPSGAVLRCRQGAGVVIPLPEEGGVTELEIERAGTQLRVRSHFVDAEVDFGTGAGQIELTDRTWDRFAHSLENVLRVVAQARALDQRQLFVHAAAVLEEGRAVLLAAPSGVGKSTAVGLSLPRQVLTDDLALIDARGGTPELISAPFHPAEPPERRRRGRWPIAAILRLRQAPEDRLERLSPAKAAASLGALVPYAADLGVGADVLTPLLAKVVSRVPVFDAHFTRSPRFWDLLADSQGPSCSTP